MTDQHTARSRRPRTTTGTVATADKPASTSGKSASKSTSNSTGKAGTATAAGPTPVLTGEEPWTDSELVDIRADLDRAATELRTEIRDAESAMMALQRDGSGDGAGDDQADAGSKTFEREHEMSLANNSRSLLAQVERALERLNKSTYGSCEGCGKPIGKARLQAFPRATLCVPCKQREERR